MFFGFQSFTVPPSIYRVDLNSGHAVTAGKNPVDEGSVMASPTLWTKVDAPSIDPSGYEVNQEWFKSKDSTRVPMFVVHKKGIQKNGRNPTLLTAYGGFNVSLTPSFSRTAYLWMEHGGVYAVANLRGGAEFGEDWHRAGMLDKKQNVFDDMIAAAEHLISEKYTDKNHLAIQGGSNGGLLMGAMMTQRPDLFRAVVCQVPLLDMLHYQDFQIAKLWIPEYGTSENAEQFKWLYALLAVSPREGGHGVSRHLIYDSGYRHASRPHAREKDGGADAGGGKERSEQDTSDLVADREQGGAWRGQAGDEADRGVHGYLFVLVLADGGEALVLSTQYSVFGECTPSLGFFRNLSRPACFLPDLGLAHTLFPLSATQPN